MSPYRMKKANDINNVYDLLIQAEKESAINRSHLSKDKPKSTNESGLKNNISEFQKIYNQN